MSENTNGYPDAAHARPVEVIADAGGSSESGRTDVGRVVRDRPTRIERASSWRGSTRFLAELVCEVAEAQTREAAERTVCDRLVDADRYLSAWVGGPSLDGDGVAVRAADGCGNERPIVRSAAPLDPAATDEFPWTLSLRTGDVQVVDAAALASAPWPRADRETEGGSGNGSGSGSGNAPGDGSESAPGDRTESAFGERPESGSVATIPFGFGDDAAGVLAVHTAHPDGFPVPELARLEAVASALGAVVDAHRSRDLLYADAAVELDCRLTDPASLLVRASDRHDSVITLAGHVATGNRWLLYLDVEGAAEGTVIDTLAADAAVERCRTVRDRANGCRLALATTDSTLPGRAAATGATVREAVADEGVCRATIEISRSADVRATVGRLRATYPDLEVRSRCDRDRPPAEPTTPSGVLDGLTDRQRTVTEAAYRAGYFEWPRDATAEEIAPELGITSATLHGHLRKAERRVLSALFD